MKENKSIFICNGIFHILVSIGLIFEKKIQNDSIIIIFNDNNFLTETIIKGMNNYNIKIKIIKNNSFFDRYILPYFVKINYVRINYIYNFINYPLGNQVIIQRLLRNNSIKEVILVEEGIASYLKIKDKFSYVNYLLLFLGLNKTNIWGNNKYINKLYLRYENEILNPLQLPTMKLDLSKLINSHLSTYKNIFNTSNYNFTNNDLIFISNSFVFKNRNLYIDYIEKIIKKIPNKNIYIKPHPREDIKIFNEISNVNILPKEIPIELIGHNTNIITFYSSAILNLNSKIKLIQYINNSDFEKLNYLMKKYKKNDYEIIS